MLTGRATHRSVKREDPRIERRNTEHGSTSHVIKIQWRKIKLIKNITDLNVTSWSVRALQTCAGSREQTFAFECFQWPEARFMFGLGGEKNQNKTENTLISSHSASDYSSVFIYC